MHANAGLFTKFLALLFEQESKLESFIERKVRDGFSPIAQQITFDTDGACVACQFGDPVTLVEGDSGVQLSIVPFTGGPSSADPFCQCPGVVEELGLVCDGAGGGDDPEPNPQPTPDPADGIRSTRMRLSDVDGKPNRRRLVFDSKDTRAAPSGIIEPAFGAAGDPTLAGATGGGARLVVYRVGGEPSDVAITILPAERWSRLDTAGEPGFLYRDPAGVDGPIRKIKVLGGDLRIRGKGAELYSLAGAPQGQMAIRLELGSGVEWCATAPAKPGPRKDTTALFVGQPGSEPPALCPPVPGRSPYGPADRAFLRPSRSLLDAPPYGDGKMERSSCGGRART